MGIKYPIFDYLGLFKRFWFTGNHQVNTNWPYRIFETGFIFGNSFAAVDLTENFMVTSFVSPVKLPVRVKFHIILLVNLNFC